MDGTARHNGWTVGRFARRTVRACAWCNRFMDAHGETGRTVRPHEADELTLSHGACQSCARTIESEIARSV